MTDYKLMLQAGDKVKINRGYSLDRWYLTIADVEENDLALAISKTRAQIVRASGLNPFWTASARTDLIKLQEYNKRHPYHVFFWVARNQVISIKGYFSNRV